MDLVLQLCQDMLPTIPLRRNLLFNSLRVGNFLNKKYMRISIAKVGSNKRHSFYKLAKRTIYSLVVDNH